jgi:hypothetical protein
LGNDADRLRRTRLRELSGIAQGGRGLTISDIFAEGSTLRAAAAHSSAALWSAARFVTGSVVTVSGGR